MGNFHGTISNFLRDSQRLLHGVEEDSFIKERILAYNYTDERLAEAIALLAETEKAESDKGQRVGEWAEASENADRMLAEADSVSRRHIDFLKLGLRNSPEKMGRVFINGTPTLSRHRLADWFMRTKKLYDRVLADSEVVLQLSNYAITPEELTLALQKVTEAEKAKNIQHRKKGTAEDSTMLRNALFERLKDATRELTVICTYALEDRPQLMEKLGVTVLSPGYKRKKKEKPSNGEEPGTEPSGTGEPAAATPGKKNKRKA